MAKVLVLYYSAYGHIEKMAEAVAELLVHVHECVAFQRLLVHGEGDVDQAIGIESGARFEQAHQAGGQQACAYDQRHGHGHF